jgi:hypothetical protein
LGWGGLRFRAILTNPRYLGREVWGKHKEIVIDPNRMAIDRLQAVGYSAGSSGAGSAVAECRVI